MFATLTDPITGKALPPELCLLVLAAQGDAQALETLGRNHADFIERIRLEGRARYDDLGLEPQQLVAGFARLASSILAAEIKRAGGGHAEARPLPSLAELVDALVPADAYLAEALVQGRRRAWLAFSRILEKSLRLVRGQYPGPGPRVVLDEIEEGLQGAMWADGRIASYRATAPLSAWTRQVVLNMVRQRLASRRARPSPVSLSTLAGDENEASVPNLPDPGATPDERVTEDEWSEVLAKVVPTALASLDRDERRMLQALPTKEITQIALAKELGVSPFKLNRWYKEVRERFLRELTHQLRLKIGLEAREADGLVHFLARSLEGKS